MSSAPEFVGRRARTLPGPLRDSILGSILVPGTPSRSARGPPNRHFGSHFGSPNRCFWSLSRFELPSQIGPHLALFSKADRGPQGVLRRCSAQRAQSAAARRLQCCQACQTLLPLVDHGRSRGQDDQCRSRIGATPLPPTPCPFQSRIPHPNPGFRRFGYLSSVSNLTSLGSRLGHVLARF